MLTVLFAFHLNMNLNYYFTSTRMAERLRRLTQDPIDNVCVGSNPTPGIFVVDCILCIFDALKIILRL